jgi:NAD(P)H-flavin reductase
VVTSWAHEKQDRLDLFVEPHKELTRELLYRVKIDENEGATSSRLILFSGPYGISALVGEYKSVLLIVARFGMAAHLPYLK